MIFAIWQQKTPPHQKSESDSIAKDDDIDDFGEESKLVFLVQSRDGSICLAPFALDVDTIGKVDDFMLPFTLFLLINGDPQRLNFSAKHMRFTMSSVFA